MELRHLWKSKWSLILIILLMFNGLLFFSSDVRLSYDKQEYIKEYAKYIDSTINSADTMSTISIFAKKDSYSYKNIALTKEAFTKCKDITLESTNDTAFEQVMSLKIRYIFILILIILATEEILVERKNGLWEVTYSETIYRKKAEFRRIISLLVVSLILQILFLASEFIIAFIRFGGLEDMSSLVQTSMICKKFPYLINKWEFLAIYFLLALLGTFLVSLFVYMSFSLFKEKLLGYALVVITCVIEVLCKEFIPTHTILNILSYTNIVTMFMPEDYMVVYANFGMNSLIINRFTLIMIVQAIFLLVLVVAILWIKEKKRPYAGSNRLEKLVQRLLNSFHSFMADRKIKAKERYKLYMLHIGVVFVIAIIAVSWNNFKINAVSYTEGESLYRNYCERYEGKVTKEALLELENMKLEIANIDAEYQKALENRDDSDESNENFMKIIFILDSYKAKREAVELIEENIEYINNMKESREIDVGLISQSAYNELLCSDGMEKEEWSLLALFIVILLITYNIFSEDKENLLYSLYKTTPNGCKLVYKARNYVYTECMFLLYAIFYGIRLGVIASKYGFGKLLLPVQSVYILEDIPFNIPIILYLIFYLAIRLGVIISIYNIIKCLSIIIENGWKTFFFSGIIILLIYVINPIKYSFLIILIGIITEVISRKKWYNWQIISGKNKH